ncbi:MAG: hypothetical protein CH6_2675 [Candidatus Kapaibacterium sp.]|nr:MAG: hypothetical protein CH6_2675 [Candidatus Kapabacteria bacterium]
MFAFFGMKNSISSFILLLNNKNKKIFSSKIIMKVTFRLY